MNNYKCNVHVNWPSEVSAKMYKVMMSWLFAEEEWEDDRDYKEH